MNWQEDHKKRLSQFPDAIRTHQIISAKLRVSRVAIAFTVAALLLQPRLLYGVMKVPRVSDYLRVLAISHSAIHVSGPSCPKNVPK